MNMSVSVPAGTVCVNIAEMQFFDYLYTII